MATSNIGYDFGNVIINHIFRSASSSASSCYFALFYSISKSEELEVWQYPPWIADSDSTAGYWRIGVSGSWWVEERSASITPDWSDPGVPGIGDWDNGRLQWSNNNYLYYVGGYGIMSGSGREDWGFLYFYNDLAVPTVVWKDCDGWTPAQDTNTVALEMGEGYSPYFCEQILNHYLNNIIYPTPADHLFMGLYTWDSVSGSTEIDDVGYFRVPCGGAGSWTEPNSASTCNTGSYVLRENVGYNWENIYGIMIFDAETGGNALLSIPFSASIAGGSYVDIIIPEEKLVIKIY